VSETIHNYRGERSWRGAAPLLLTCLLPVALMGVAIKPALDAGDLSERLSSARERAVYARGLSGFFADFGEGGPPTESYEHIESLLLGRLPETVEVTALYRAVLYAASGLDLSMDSIVAGSEEDLGLPAGEKTVHERRAVLKGHAQVHALTSFLAALHREGYPVCVHSCTLHALAEQPGLFDFQIEIGAFFLSEPALPEDPYLTPL